MAPKAKVAPAAKKATAHTARPKGLQLSAAQWKAYTSAYNSVANAGFTKLAIQGSAAGLRKYRLGAAYSLGKKVAAAHTAARTAAIAKFAAAQTLRQSRLGHQNAALQNRVYANYARHVQVAARLQFSYRGERAYLHTAVMNTLTTAQAVAIETASYAKAAKAAKAAVTSTTTAASSSAKSSPAVARITAAAKAAGLAAAKATPAGRTAPRPEGAVAALYQESPWCAPWYGDPDGYDCVAAALASQLLHACRFALTPGQYASLVRAAGTAPQLEQALVRVSERLLPGFPARLADYEQGYGFALPGDVIGFATEKGPHAALYLGDGLIASWGEVLALDAVITGEIEETWSITWAVG